MIYLSGDRLHFVILPVTGILMSFWKEANMPDRETEFKMPPVVAGEGGGTRKVGVEIEFAAKDAGEIASLVARLYSGNREKENDHRYRIVGTAYGTFTVELDTQYAHPAKQDKQWGNPLDQWLDLEIDKFVHSVVGHIAKTLVPYEIVTPPIPMDRLPDLTPLMDALRRIGVEGTDENPFYAFGVHLNPEAPAFTADSICNHLRAFIALSDWLHDMMEIDLARKLSPYIQKFPTEYALRIMPADYRPDLPQLIDDYLELNPTRNRELDLVPLFMHLDRERVEAVLQDGLSSARPTYHYRLPDCRLNDDRWSLAREWNFWVEVERLAVDAERLDAICSAFIEHNARWIKWKWVDKARPWLPRLGPAS